MKRLNFFFSLIFLILLIPVYGQKNQVPAKSVEIKEDTLRKPFAVFSDDVLLEVSIRFNLTTYLRKNLNGGSLNEEFNRWADETELFRKEFSAVSLYND